MGKESKKGTSVATPATPLSGTAVQQWMGDAVVVPRRSLKVTSTLMVSVSSSMNTVAEPTPGLAFGGLSAGPLRLVTKVTACADPASASATAAERARMDFERTMRELLTTT